MDLTFIYDYYVPVVLLICLIVGYCIKHIKRLDKVANEYIPAILSLLGVILCCIENSSVDLNSIACGAFSGLASTGVHQLFYQLINKDKNNKESEE